MPISDCEVRDPRIRRTRQLLQGALRNLMQEKGFDEISVQDITDAATLNRATFYDHYADKYALLAAMVGSDFHKLLFERNVTFDCTCPSAASAVILATCDYLSLTHSGTGGYNCNSPFEPLMEAAIISAIHRTLLKGIVVDGASPSPSPELIATTASWAIYGAVKHWFYTPNHPPSAEIVPPILELILPLLRTAGRASHQSASLHFRSNQADITPSN